MYISLPLSLSLYIYIYSRIGRGDDTVGSPHRAQISQFELFGLKVLNSSFSSFPLTEVRRRVSYRTIRGKSRDSRQQYLSQQYPPNNIT